MSVNAVDLREAAAKLDKLRNQVQDMREAKARAEARLEEADRNLARTVAEIKELGLRPEDLQATIEKMWQELQSVIEKAERLLGGE